MNPESTETEYDLWFALCERDLRMLLEHARAGASVDEIISEVMIQARFYDST